MSPNTDRICGFTDRWTFSFCRNIHTHSKHYLYQPINTISVQHLKTSATSKDIYKSVHHLVCPLCTTTQESTHLHSTGVQVTWNVTTKFGFNILWEMSSWSHASSSRHRHFFDYYYKALWHLTQARCSSFWFFFFIFLDFLEHSSSTASVLTSKFSMINKHMK